jgi:hypothetical protein
MQLLEKDPASRPQSAGALARSLRALTDVEAWTPEQAELWWKTNLPNATMAAPGPDEMETADMAESDLACTESYV